jgi:hypothetical protein
MSNTKLCLICKQQLENESFNDHFKECRKKRLELESQKIQGDSITQENTVTKKKGGCGCKKKKRS